MATKVTPLRVDGADISHHQANVDLALAKSKGLGFLYHKCTEGTTFKDSKYQSRMQSARKIHLPFGAYHFAHVSAPEAQAEFFLKTAAVKPGDMRPMLDLEHADFARLSTEARTAWVVRFIRVIHTRTGHYPFIYTPFTLSRVPEVLACPLWVARYHPTNESPRVPAPWGTYTLRQFSNGQVGVPSTFPGLGHVDLNTWNSKDPARMLAAFTLPQPSPAPKPTPKPPPKPTPVVKRKSAALRVSTANIQNFPDMSDRQVRADVAVTSTFSDLVLWQEIAEKADHTALVEASGKGWHTTAVTVETPVSARLSVLKPVGAPIVTKLADGLGEGSKSPARYMTEQRYTWTVPTDLPDVWVICVHYVQQAWGRSKVPKKHQRQVLWNAAHSVHRTHAIEASKKGFIVIGGGDWNRAVADIPKFHSKQKWIIAGGGLDHVYVLAQASVNTGFGSTVQQNLNSDHNLRTVRLSVSK